MNTDTLSAIVVIIGLIGLITANGYAGYLAWFHPERFKEREVNRVKNWWPFANFFRSYHNSSELLWTVRIMSVIILLIFLFFAILTFLGIMGFFP